VRRTPRSIPPTRWRRRSCRSEHVRRRGDNRRAHSHRKSLAAEATQIGVTLGSPVHPARSYIRGRAAPTLDGPGCCLMRALNAHSARAASKHGTMMIRTNSFRSALGAPTAGSLPSRVLTEGIRDYAFWVGARLCDPTKPLLVGFAIEAALAGRAIAAWARTARQTPGARRNSDRRRGRSRVHPSFDRRKGILAHRALHAPNLKRVIHIAPFSESFQAGA
jgi:hypothetical protein